jgi:hypothetical protein
MRRRLRRWVVLGLLAVAAAGVLAVTSLPYLPLIHGTTAGEVEHLAAWLEVQPGRCFAYHRALSLKRESKSIREGQMPTWLK